MTTKVPETKRLIIYIKFGEKTILKLFLVFSKLQKLYLHPYRLTFCRDFYQQLIQQLKYFVTYVQCLVFLWLIYIIYIFLSNCLQIVSTLHS